MSWASIQQGVLCKWGTTLLLQLCASFGCSSRVMNKAQHKDIYEIGIRLDVNVNVLERIYSSNVTAEKSFPIEFFYVSDQEEKLKSLGLYLLKEYPQYTDLRIKPYQDNYELLATTHPIKIDLASVNEWNEMMWDIGYQFDCKLDGRQVGT